MNDKIHYYIFFFLLFFLLPLPWQVLRQKQVDSPEVQQVSVRRFSTFDLFTRRPAATTQDSTTDGQWVEYTSVFSPEYSAFLM